ncbi:MAG: ArsR family transcriptional regulator [Dehalococcoidia bacterium]|nr:ArsR family transcriptional regulator [Dehalococcoidia bacterium]
MESTRQTLLGILRKRKQATVDQLTRELGLAPATVRRHLDILMRDNYVTAAQKRRDIGRPHYVFSLTDQGDDLFPRNYIRLTNRIIAELVSLGPEETKGKAGVDIASVIFEKMAGHVAQTYAGRISGTTLKERAQEVISLLANEGMFFELRKAKEGYLLLGQGCPCPRIADTHSEVCVHDQRLLARLLDAEVQPAGVSQREDERSCCAYLVKEKASPS